MQASLPRDAAARDAAILLGSAPPFAHAPLVYRRLDAMALPRKAKLLLVLLPFVAVLVLGGWKGLQYWWYRAYSTGSRTGVVRKVSVKGPPYCKYLAGELAVQGATPIQAEIWEFSVDDDADANPVVVALHDAEKSGARVTLHYRQDLHSMFRCTPSEYFVTSVEK
jgi:hypothetical protein